MLLHLSSISPLTQKATKSFCFSPLLPLLLRTPVHSRPARRSARKIEQASHKRLVGGNNLLRFHGLPIIGHPQGLNLVAGRPPPSLSKLDCQQARTAPAPCCTARCRLPVRPCHVVSRRYDDVDERTCLLARLGCAARRTREGGGGGEPTGPVKVSYDDRQLGRQLKGGTPGLVPSLAFSIFCYFAADCMYVVIKAGGGIRAGQTTTTLVEVFHV